jgi:hypothetical protein
LEDFSEFVNTTLNFTDLLLALLDERLLVCELVGGQLLLEHLSLTLHRGVLVLGRWTVRD